MLHRREHRDKIVVVVELSLTDYTLRARNEYRQRWVDYTHEVEPGFPDGEYDLSIPEIHIEWLLCDLSVMRLVKSKKHRHRFYGMLTPEELDVWFNREDENGCRYCDLEKGSLVGAVGKALTHARRDKRNNTR